MGKSSSQSAKIRVLSLFDGISCAQVALLKAGIVVESYFASEIDPFAIKVAQYNFPSTVQLGDVKEIISSLIGKIDLVIGGSPCQDLSIAKANRSGLDGEKSSLFWEFVRILQEIKPKYFILENVASMRAVDKKTISETLQVVPVQIDSALVSAQRRRRLFWTNIGDIGQPIDQGVRLKEILINDFPPELLVKNANLISRINRDVPKSFSQIDGEKAIPMLTSQYSSWRGQYVTTTGGGLRQLDPRECERLQGLPDGYTKVVSKSQRYRLLGNAFNVDVIVHILSSLKSKSDKSC